MSERQQPKELVIQIRCLKPIEDYIYSTMNHTPEWEQAERAFQYILHSRPHPALTPKCGCDGCRKEIEHLDCPTPGHCDQMKCPVCCEGSDFPTLPEEIKKYEAAAARQAREDVLSVILDCAETDGEWFRIDGTDTLYLNYSVLSKKAESLRSTQQQAGDP